MPIAEADLDLTQSTDPRFRFAGDERLHVTFSLQPHPNEEESEKQGRPIFYDREYITIMVPGDKDNVVFRPVRPFDKQRFVAQYRAFQANESQEVQGTPLTVWPGISRAQVEELKFFNVRTVEQLVTMSDVSSQRFLGINELKARANSWLEASKGNAELEKLNAELKKRDDQIAALMAAVEEQSGKIKALEKAKK